MQIFLGPVWMLRMWKSLLQMKIHSNLIQILIFMIGYMECSRNPRFPSCSTIYERVVRI